MHHSVAPRLAAFLFVAVLRPGAMLGQGASSADLARQVFAAESSFAATMANRDLAAFAEFVAAEAVFIGDSAIRGREHVVAAWRRYFEGPGAPFSWRPETVEVLPSGTLALTSGPVFDRAGNLTNIFTSIWRLDADGRWRVIFDKGCPAGE
jgi:ketosteroid isomerase-like protein